MSAPLVCKLTAPGLRERKKTVLAGLRSLMTKQTELHEGIKLEFATDDETLDVIHHFIKTERQCCDFFVFTLTVAGSGEGVTSLSLTGPPGARKFIKDELGF